MYVVSTAVLVAVISGQHTRARAIHQHLPGRTSTTNTEVVTATTGASCTAVLIVVRTRKSTLISKGLALIFFGLIGGVE